MQYNYTTIYEKFRFFLVAENVSSSTVKNYLSDVRYFFGWYQTYYLKNFPFVSFANDGFILNPEYERYVNICNTYCKYLNDGPFSTLRRRIYGLKKFVLFCMNKGLIYPNIGSKVIKLLEQKI